MLTQREIKALYEAQEEVIKHQFKETESVKNKKSLFIEIIVGNKKYMRNWEGKWFYNNIVGFKHHQKQMSEKQIRMIKTILLETVEE